MNTVAALIAACVALSHVGTPQIAIIIDDLGYQLDVGRDVIALPGPVAIGIVPFAPHTRNLARLARASDKDVIVHMPMEADDRNHLLGDGALFSSMAKAEFTDSVIRALDQLPGAIGMNNHMGSRLSRERQHIDWLMHVIRDRSDAFFVDSRTTTGSVIGKSARAAGVDYVVRDVFLDSQPGEAHVREQLDTLAARARARGYALAIGHPYPSTLASLADWDPAAHGVTLVRLSEYVEQRSGKSVSDCARNDAAGETPLELTLLRSRPTATR